MKKPIWAGTCAAIFAIASIAMSAQNPPSNSTPQGRSESTDRKVTVTGCLEAAPQSATPATPAAEARGDQAGAAKTFVLTNAARDRRFLLTNPAWNRAKCSPQNARSKERRQRLTCELRSSRVTVRLGA